MISLRGQIPIFLIIGFSMVASFFPQVSELLVYDRQGILKGQLWRLLTAPLVHFSGSHFFWDMVVFCFAAVAINISGFRHFRLICILSAFIPGIIFFLALPELERYGGLSGITTGAVTYYSLCSILKVQKNRVIWLTVIILIASKIVLEIAIDAPLFVQTVELPFRVLPEAHVLGFIIALSVIVCSWPNIYKRAPIKTGGEK